MGERENSPIFNGQYVQTTEKNGLQNCKLICLVERSLQGVLGYNVGRENHTPIKANPVKTGGAKLRV